jgi:hypothetical protein
MRYSEIKRKTAETDISLRLDLDGEGKSNINSGCGFLDHMLTLFAKHAHYDLDINCKGDVEVDYHHTVEDIGICLGKAFLEALGDKRGITRYGDIILPMDETLIMCAVDISGRDYLGFALDIPENVKDKTYVAGAVIKNGVLVTNGGRVLGTTAIADTLPEAIEKAYGYVKEISFDNAYWRNDIGAKALKALGE